jgi:MFS family permease
MKKHPLSPAEVSRGMTASIWDGILAGPFYNVIAATSPFFTGLALTLGADNFQIGLFAAVSPLLAGLSLLSAHMMERGSNRKKHYLFTAAIQRSLFLVLLAFPFLATRLEAGTLVWVLLALVTSSWVFHYFQLTAWMSWMADMIPADRRGSFFSRRGLIASATWMSLSYLAGRYLDTHRTLWDYAVVFSLFTVSSLIGLRFAAQQPDPPLALAAKHPSLKALWKTAYADKAFRNFVFFNLAWNFTANLAALFLNVYMLKNLQMDLAHVTVLGVLASLLATVSAPWWGHVLDRAGERATLFFSMVGACVLGGLWPFLTRENLVWLLPFILIVGGFFQAGVQQSSFNMFLGILPAKNKSSYVALSQTVIGTLVGWSPILGGWLAITFAKTGMMEGWPFDSVMLVIVLSALLKLIPLGLVSAMQNRPDRGIAYMVQEYVLVNPLKVMASISLDLFGADRDKK